MVADAPAALAQVADDHGGRSGADERHVARDGVVDVLARSRLVPGDDGGARVAVERPVDLQDVPADGHGLWRPIGELQAVLPPQEGEQLAGDDLPGLGRRPESLELGELAAHPGQLLAHDGLESALGGARRRGDDQLAVALDGDADGPPPRAPAHGEGKVVHRPRSSMGGRRRLTRGILAHRGPRGGPARRSGRPGGYLGFDPAPYAARAAPKRDRPCCGFGCFRAARPYGRCSPASCRSGLR